MDGETPSGSGAKCRGATELGGKAGSPGVLHCTLQGSHYKEEVARRERERGVGGGEGREQGISPGVGPRAESWVLSENFTPHS